MPERDFRRYNHGNRKIGSLDVSVTGLGCNNFGWRLDYDHTVAVVDAALDAGINFLDTADIYGPLQSEEYLGRALQGRRDQVVLATKFGMKVDDQRKGAKPDYVRQACEDSLRRLRTDHIDLYQLHQPDPETPDRRHARRARRAGAGRQGARDRLLELLRRAAPGGRGRGGRRSEVRQRPERIQPAAPRSRARASSPSASARGWRSSRSFRSPAACSPASTGSASRRPRTPVCRRGTPVSSTTATSAIAEELIGFAAFRGHSLLELAFSWLLSHPQVASVIAGATSPEQVQANVHAAGWHLDHAELAEIDKLAPAATPGA